MHDTVASLRRFVPGVLEQRPGVRQEAVYLGTTAVVLFLAIALIPNKWRGLSLPKMGEMAAKRNDAPPAKARIWLHARGTDATQTGQNKDSSEFHGVWNE